MTWLLFQKDNNLIHWNLYKPVLMQLEQFRTKQTPLAFLGTRKTSVTPPCNISCYFNVALLHFCSKGDFNKYDYCLYCKPKNVFCCHVNMVTIANKPEFWMNEYWINDVLVYSRVSIIRDRCGLKYFRSPKFENGKNRKTNFVNVITVITHCTQNKMST